MLGKLGVPLGDHDSLLEEVLEDRHAVGLGHQHFTSEIFVKSQVSDVKRNKGLDLESADVKVTVCLLVVLVLVVGLLVVDLEVSQLVGVLKVFNFIA